MKIPLQPANCNQERRQNEEARVCVGGNLYRWKMVTKQEMAAGEKPCPGLIWKFCSLFTYFNTFHSLLPLTSLLLPVASKLSYLSPSFLIFFFSLKFFPLRVVFCSYDEMAFKGWRNGSVVKNACCTILGKGIQIST